MSNKKIFYSSPATSEMLVIDDAGMRYKVAMGEDIATNGIDFPWKEVNSYRIDTDGLGHPKLITVVRNDRMSVRIEYFEDMAQIAALIKQHARWTGPPKMYLRLETPEWLRWAGRSRLSRQDGNMLLTRWSEMPTAQRVGRLVILLVAIVGATALIYLGYRHSQSAG